MERVLVSPFLPFGEIKIHTKIENN